MRSWLEQGRYQAALAASDGETVAYVVWREDPDYDDVFVRQFFVVREHGGHGLGHQLFEEAAAEYWPGRLLRLDVNDSNPGGGRFWERLGFAPYSRAHAARAGPIERPDHLERRLLDLGRVHT